ncbi:MAG: endonuclease III [Clostridia bacterium]|nr:endonuclease III [Clostridia bacterium]
MTQKERVRFIIDTLSELYPESGAELRFSNPYETLIATMLSAQCTDKRVNIVTASLFRDYPDAKAMARISLEELEQRIKTCGLYHSKARHIIDACSEIARKYDGQIPKTRNELTALPGVGNKTAGVVVMEAYGQDVIPVDTHVFRLAHRMDLATSARTADETEKQLDKIIPAGEKAHTHHLLILHGRRICKAVKPDCDVCPLRNKACFHKEDK